MVEMLPFRGVHYALNTLDGAVLAPPYDIISEADRLRLVGQHPHNIARIDVTPQGADPANWYALATERLRDSLSEGILVQDTQPAYYAYVQQFVLPDRRTFTRRGLFAAVRLAEWGKGIYRHEFTRTAPRADRLNLMRATRAQLSPVFGMLSDPGAQLQAWLQPPDKPWLDYTDADGVRQIFWAIDSANELKALRSYLADKEIVIADGHHRYETALAYRDERRAAVGAPADAQDYDYVLMYVCAVEDPGLVILPTHRVVRGLPGFDIDKLLRCLSERFVVESAPADVPLEEAIRRSSNDRVAFGVYTGANGRFICRRRTAADAAARAAGAPETLDVAILQHSVMEGCLGIDAAALKGGENVFYTIHEDEAAGMVARGEAQATFILNPTLLSQIWESARRLETMPQKSTYFYPKLLTGLVLRLL
ncbi:MAG: DUF1015 domain-containing protein [Chloroflexi bacterium]|nr:DUF1015 domain-containing protein [Chloroflexota bacterium]